MDGSAPSRGGLQPSLPSRDYTSAEAFAAERERILFREWMAVCRGEEIAGPGDWRVFDVAGESILVVRDGEGWLHSVYNVCRHRGARLCPSEPARPDRAPLPGQVSRTGLIRCPYHGWTYAASGELVAAPHLGDDPAFDRVDFALHQVGCEEWGGFVFLHLTPAEAPSLLADAKPAAGRMANYPLAELRIGHRIAYEVEANWKLLCENYNECYHCGPLHPELCALVPAFRAGGGADLEWERGIPHREGATTFTWSGTTARAPFPGLDADERERHKGELLYPNLFLSLSADYVAAFILRPRGPARTQVDCLFLFHPDEMARPGFDPGDAASFWDVVNRQDWAICERVQQGLGSRVHLQGVYAPMEDANLDMRRYIRDRMERP